MSSAVSFPRKASRVSRKDLLPPTTSPSHLCLSSKLEPEVGEFYRGDAGNRSIFLSGVMEKLCKRSGSLFVPIIGQQWHHCECLPEKCFISNQPRDGHLHLGLWQGRVPCPCAHLLYQGCEFPSCPVRFHLSLPLKLIVFFSLPNPFEKLHNNTCTSQSSFGEYIC